MLDTDNEKVGKRFRRTNSDVELRKGKHIHALKQGSPIWGERRRDLYEKEFGK